MENEERQVQTQKRRWRREPVVMGDGQKFVYNMMYREPIGRISTAIVLILSLGGSLWLHNMMINLFCVGWLTGQWVLLNAAWAYDKKNQSTKG